MLCVLKRNVNNPKFEPRWKAKPNKPQSKCSIQNCDNAACKNTNLASGDQIERLIGKPIVTFTIEEDASTVRLCQVHYNQLYVQLHLSSLCESCGGKPRKAKNSTGTVQNQIPLTPIWTQSVVILAVSQNRA